QYVEIVFICNLELLCRGKYIPWSRYQERKQLIDIDENGKKQTLSVIHQDKSEKGSVLCPYVKRINHNSVNNNNQGEESNNQDNIIDDDDEFQECTYEWKLPPYTTVIFDEAHKVINNGTCFNRLVKGLVDKYGKQPMDKCRVRCV